MTLIPRRLRSWLSPSSEVAEPTAPITPLTAGLATTAGVPLYFEHGWFGIPTFIAPKRPKKKTQTEQTREELRLLLAEVEDVLNRHEDLILRLGIPQMSLDRKLTRIGVELEEAQRQDAWAKARQLLLDHLDKKQKKELAKTQGFTVKGQVMTYRIGMDAQVRVGPGPQEGTRFCVSTEDRTMPLADQVLATKLFIEGDEAGFLAVANPNADYRRKLTPEGVMVPSPAVEPPRGANGRYITAFGDAFFDATVFGDTTRTYLTPGTATNTINTVIPTGGIKPDIHPQRNVELRKRCPGRSAGPCSNRSRRCAPCGARHWSILSGSG